MDSVARFAAQNGLSLWLWPEGTRSSKDGSLQAFKKGFVHAALADKLPIVPVVVYGAAKIFPRGKLKFNPGPSTSRSSFPRRTGPSIPSMTMWRWSARSS